jgi:hypothetical protein
VLVSIASTQAQVQYQRYGTPGFDAFQAMTTTPDGSVWVAGTRDKQGWVAKLDENGRIKKEIRVPFVAPAKEINILGIDPGENGNLILTGITHNGPHSRDWFGWVGVLNANGQLLMQGIVDEGVKLLKGRQQGNHLFVAGYDAFTCNCERAVYKLTLSKMLIWKKREVCNSASALSIGNIIPDGDGCILSWTQNTFSNWTYFLERYDGTGKKTVLNSYTEFGVSRSFFLRSAESEALAEPFAISRDENGHEWVVVWNSTDFMLYLMEFDTQGNFISKAEYPMPDKSISVGHLRILDNGDKIIAGTEGNYVNTRTVDYPFLMVIDKEGKLVSKERI